MADNVLTYTLGLPRTRVADAPLRRPGAISFSPVQIILICMILAGVFQILLHLRGFYSSTLDETGRTLDAYMWVTGRGSFVAVWLPFHRLFVGLSVWITGDLLITPRIVACLFGFAAIAAIVLLAEELFHDRRTTLLAGLLGTLLPERVILGAVPLAEIMFVLFVLLGMLGMARYRRLPDRRHLWFAAAMFAVSGAVRYEGWVFSFVFAVWSVVSSRRARNFRWTDFVALSLLLGLFPVCWLALNAQAYGNPLEFLSATSGRYVRIHGIEADGLLRNNVITQFLLLNLVSGNILGILVVWRSRLLTPAARSVLHVAGLTILVLALQMILAKGLPTHAFWRIAAVWSILLVPFTARVVRAGLAHRFPGFRAFALVSLVLVLSLCLRGTYVRTESSALSRDDIAAGEFLQMRLSNNPGATVLIESVIWSYTNIMIASHTPERFLYNTGFDPLEHQPPFLRTDTPLTRDQLGAKGIDFLVFRTDEYIEFLGSSKLVRLTGQYGPWYIYEVL